MTVKNLGAAVIEGKASINNVNMPLTTALESAVARRPESYNNNPHDALLMRYNGYVSNTKAQRLTYFHLYRYFTDHGRFVTLTDKVALERPLTFLFHQLTLQEEEKRTKSFATLKPYNANQVQVLPLPPPCPSGKGRTVPSPPPPPNRIPLKVEPVQWIE